MTESFPLGTVLTITTGIMLCEVGEIYRILDYMTGDQLFTHQLPRASDECRDPLLEQHPHLRDVVVPEGLNTWEKVHAWLAEAARTYGDPLPVAPLRSEDHTRIDPLLELHQMTDKPIIAVHVDGDSA